MSVFCVFVSGLLFSLSAPAASVSSADQAIFLILPPFISVALPARRFLFFWLARHRLFFSLPPPPPPPLPSLSLSLSSENAARADDTPPPQIQDGFTDANGRSRARGWRPAGCQERGHGRGARRGRRDPRRYVTETPVARVSTDPNGAGRDREKVCRVGRQDRQDTLCQGCHPQL